MTLSLKIMAALVLIALILFLFLLYKGRAVDMPKSTELGFYVPEPVKEVLYYASLAPNGHNAQMWQVFIDESQGNLLVKLAEERLLTQVDPDNKEAYISMGAFLKNMQVAFNAMGYVSDINIEKDHQSPDNLMARVHFEKADHTENAGKINHHSLNLILKRHSDKRPFSDKPIDSDTIKALCDNIPGLVYFPKGTKAFDIISSQAVAAYTQQANNADKQTELVKWLRFSDTETYEKADGLPAEQLGLDGIIKALYYLTVDENTARGDRFISQGIQKFSDQALNAAGFFILTGEDNPQNWIRAGQLTQTLWLDATEKEIVMMPMSQMMEEMPFKESVPKALALPAPMQMIIRAGYVTGSYGQNNRIRRPLKEFVFLLT